MGNPPSFAARHRSYPFHLKALLGNFWIKINWPQTHVDRCRQIISHSDAESSEIKMFFVLLLIPVKYAIAPVE